MARNKRTRTTNFIDRAIEKPGSFRAYCKRQGHEKVNATCIREALASRNTLTRQRANLARNLARIRRG